MKLWRLRSSSQANKSNYRLAQQLINFDAKPYLAWPVLEFACDRSNAYGACKNGDPAFSQQHRQKFSGILGINIYHTGKIVLCNRWFEEMDSHQRIHIMVHELSHIYLDTNDKVGTGGKVYLNPAYWGDWRKIPNLKELGPTFHSNMPEGTYRIREESIPGPEGNWGYYQFLHHADALTGFIMEWNE